VNCRSLEVTASDFGVHITRVDRLGCSERVDVGLGKRDATVQCTGFAGSVTGMNGFQKARESGGRGYCDQS
jgi:hypothetical protein